MSIDPNVHSDEPTPTPTPTPAPEPEITASAEEVKTEEVKPEAVVEQTEPVTETKTEPAAEPAKEPVKDPEIIIETEPETKKPHPQDEALAMMGEMKVYKHNDLVTGSIVQVTDDTLIVDIGTKTEGVINRDEISYGPVVDMNMFNVGDKISAVIINEDEEGNYTLSKRRADQHLVWDKVDESMNKGVRLAATGFRAVKGGLLVDIGTIAFLPQSLLDIKRIDDLEQFVGQKFDVKVVEYDREAKPHPKIVVSRRSILEEDLTAERDSIYDNLAMNSVVDGKVIKLTNYGAFVDIGGLQGLLHISEMSLGRINHPSEVMKEGDTIKVKLLKVDRKKKRISLGRRELLPNPWEVIGEKYKAGRVVEGIVVRVADFGAFIKLDEYFEGLAHISELVDNKISHAKEVFKTGDKVNVYIMNIDKRARRIKLSVKRAVDAQRRAEVKEFLKAQGDLGDMFANQLKDALKDSEMELEGDAKAAAAAAAEKKSEEKPAEEKPEAEVKVEAAVEETPVVEAPVEETPAPEAPAEETPAKEAAPEPEAPAEEKAAKEAAPEPEAPAEEKAEPEVKVEAAVEETPVVEAPVEETPAPEAPAEEKASETPSDEPKADGGELNGTPL